MVNKIRYTICSFITKKPCKLETLIADEFPFSERVNLKIIFNGEFITHESYVLKKLIDLGDELIIIDTVTNQVLATT